ncbi:MAG: ABC transporter substrate-binding protein [Actinomycetota bacterium]|nr:ABC transporter substrate-binding protein [Actinomycetota bacterium]
MSPRAVAAALLPALLAGCSTVAASPGPIPLTGARSGGVLRVGITAPGTVDPGSDYEPSGDLVLRTMCDPLIAVDGATGTLRPALAASWVVTDGGRRVVVRLRQGVHFPDGSALTADDVAYSLSRVAAAEYASAASALLAPIDGFPQVHGDVATDSDTDRRRLSGVHVLDRQSLQISFSRPSADWLQVLTTPVTSPVPRHLAERDPAAFARQPVCVGPYRLSAPWHAGDASLALDRVAGYRPVQSALTGGGVGYADRIEFRVFSSRDAAAAGALAGQVDVAPARPGDRAVAVTGPLVDYIGLPTTTPPFDRTDVRQALAGSIDRAAIVAELFPHTREPATGFLPPTTRPAYRATACGTGGTATQPLSSLRVPFYYNDDGRNRALVTAVAHQWRRHLGLVAVPTPLSYADFLVRGRGQQGFDGPFRFSWSITFPDPGGYLGPLFGTAGIGRDNLSRFSDPAVDEALTKRAAEATDAQDRTLEQRRIELLLCAAMPMIPLTFSLSRYVISARLGAAGGSALDVSTGEPLVRELYLRG